jgi:hypothetical protein
MNGEPTRLVDDSSVREELRERLTREAATPPYKYDFEKGLKRLRAAIAAESPDAGRGSPATEPPPAGLSVAEYATKGSMWKVGSVVGLAGVALIVGIRAWSPVRNVGRAEASAPASAPSPEEEREALAIQELAASGRGAEAKTRAARFLERYPESPLAERVRTSAKP